MQYQITLYVEAGHIADVFRDYAHIGNISVKEIPPNDRAGTPYPEFCRYPTACRAKGRCTSAYCCAD